LQFIIHRGFMVCMIHLHIMFHMPSCNGSLVLTIKGNNTAYVEVYFRTLFYWYVFLLHCSSLFCCPLLKCIVNF
jgi:hypothetical protein